MPFVVGRAESADLKLVSNRVSREHAVLSWEAGQFWIRDLGSTNGTFVNGTRIDREPIKQIADTFSQSRRTLFRNLERVRRLLFECINRSVVLEGNV